MVQVECVLELHCILMEYIEPTQTPNKVNKANKVAKKAQLCYIYELHITRSGLMWNQLRLQQESGFKRYCNVLEYTLMKISFRDLSICEVQGVQPVTFPFLQLDFQIAFLGRVRNIPLQTPH